MERDTVSWWRLWVVFGPGVAASLLPALLLTPPFAHPGRHLSTLFAFWTELLVTPSTPGAPSCSAARASSPSTRWPAPRRGYTRCACPSPRPTCSSPTHLPGG